MKNRAGLGVLFLIVFAGVEAMAAQNTEGRVITKERFNKVVKVLIDTVKRQKELEEQIIVMQDKLREAKGGNDVRRRHTDAPAQLGAEIPSSDDSAVDLSALDSAPAQAAASGGNPHGGGGGGGGPHFNLYFDFWLLSQPGAGFNQGDGFTFASIHNFFLVEAVANADLKFIAEISANPRYFEMDYQLNRWFQLRLGKISIPFDDMQPHNMFGGRMNVSRFRSSGTQTDYLPTIWADLGVGGKFTLIDRASLNLEAHAFVVNGFRQGGTDPVTASSRYPSFGEPASGSSDADNNRQKSYGGRIHALISQTFGLGLSYYAGRWTNKDELPADLRMLGTDLQLYLGRWETRMGASFMDVDLPASNTGKTFHRPGYYVETSYKLGQKRQWKLLAAFGGVNNDDRIVNVDDKQITLGKIIYRPNNIEWSLEHSVDTRVLAAKGNRSVTGLRVVMMF